MAIESARENPKLHVTNRAVFAIAVPTSLGFLTTPLVGIADTAVIGQLGEAALIGGVGVAAILISLFLTTFNFLRFATSALTAQAFGRNDEPGSVAVLLRSMLIALVTGVALILLQVPLLSLGLFVIDPSLEVASAASDYFLVRIWAIPFTLLNFVFLAWLVGVGRPVFSFILQTFLNVVNIALTYWLVLHANMGVEGAALGTVLAEAMTALLTLFALIPRVKPFARGWLRLVFNRAELTRMMMLNSDILVRSFCLQLAFIFFTRQSAQQNDVVLAANEILLHFFMIAGYFLDGFAVAVEQFVGRAMGAKSDKTFRQAVYRTSAWNLVQASLLSLFFLVAGKTLIDFMTVAEDVRNTAYLFLPWAALTPMVGVAAFQMDGVFIGATWSKDMRNSMVVSLGLMIAAYFIFFPYLENHGLWLALWIFLGLRGVSLFWRMRQRLARGDFMLQ